MIKYLQNKGLAITQRKGSHVTMRDGNVVTVVPAGSKKMRIGILFAIAVCRHKQGKVCRGSREKSDKIRLAVEDVCGATPAFVTPARQARRHLQA